MMIQKQMWTDNPSEWTEDELLLMKYKGICYGKGSPPSPPPAPAVQTTVNQSEFPSELKPFIEDIFGKAQAIQQQKEEEGFQTFPGPLQTDFDPTQVRAFEEIEQIPGRTAPLFDEATDFARQATAAPIDPAEQAAFMNPFLRNVVDIQKREAERIADVQKQQLDAQAVQAGAFGGSRPAIIEAERQRNLNEQLGDIEARGLAAAFQDAQSRIAQQRQREAGGAAQLASLGAAIPAQQLKELGALSGVGAARQTQGQRGIDLARQEFEAEEAFPLQNLQEFQSILRGFPIDPIRRTEQSTFSTAQPLSSQLLGTAVGLQGLSNFFGGTGGGKAGGMVQRMPVVKMAQGGSFVEQLLTGGLLGTDKAQSVLEKIGHPGVKALTGFMGPKFIKAARGLVGKELLGGGAATPTPAPSAALTPATPQLTPQQRKELLEQELRRIAAQGQQTASRGTGIGQVGTQLAGVRQNVGAKGGGGLRQMVKLPLPSNRVKFGKGAYSNGSMSTPTVPLSGINQFQYDVPEVPSGDFDAEALKELINNFIGKMDIRQSLPVNTTSSGWADIRETMKEPPVKARGPGEEDQAGASLINRESITKLLGELPAGRGKTMPTVEQAVRAHHLQGATSIPEQISQRVASGGNKTISAINATIQHLGAIEGVETKARMAAATAAHNLEKSRAELEKTLAETTKLDAESLAKFGADKDRLLEAQASLATVIGSLYPSHPQRANLIKQYTKLNGLIENMFSPEAPGAEGKARVEKQAISEMSQRRQDKTLAHFKKLLNQFQLKPG